MTRVLVLGAHGQIGSRVVAGLRSEGAGVRAATRHPRAGDDVLFDWADPGTWPGALDGVAAVHLLPPQGDPDPAATVGPFLELARGGGVGRVVLLSSSAIEPGGAGLGEVHAHIALSWPEWAVLRPSWFMQNFSGEHLQAQSIRSADEVVSATGDGRVGFVDVDDIAAVAVRALLDPEAHNRDHVLTGPEALSYDEVAAVVSGAAGRTVRHRRLDVAGWTEEIAARTGLDPSFARMLADMDAAIAGGGASTLTSTVADVTGRPPGSFAEHCRRHAGAFDRV
ncbi:NmrA family NAD(P)-binding protein [Auraticoccus monumenti]|uniref:Uncharacterized conserved protein YbjT, contains NAD(P)-binding and DUF2867 domains n=1 Tax=Auraticoccus monumenti TaxID=675864 RepID=A0A1G6U9C5_9ACTN|nr:NmrA family NAD(P)-binding protein [Auraticoccus monumenti]SDD37968.1 Uncharacterized conserved protein YbjT, contains NAD(P)-binding and DUF2867 domains [Auraticoccus monumenti]